MPCRCLRRWAAASGSLVPVSEVELRIAANEADRRAVIEIAHAANGSSQPLETSRRRAAEPRPKVTGDVVVARSGRGPGDACFWGSDYF